MAMNVREDFKFRITCKMHFPAQQEVKPTIVRESEFEFRYATLEKARKNYKAILLGLYKKKELVGFAICLNRCRDRKWSKAIFKEKVSG